MCLFGSKVWHCDLFPDGTLWQAAAKLNSLLGNENERLKQFTEDLKQKHSHMTSEVQTILCFALQVKSYCTYCVKSFEKSVTDILESV